MSIIQLYPILLERRIVEPIWGGQRLAKWLDLPEPQPTQLGETWQVFDTNIILNGVLAGQTLAQVTKQFGADFIGTRTVARYGIDFPLLAKFIDANDKLSIQVHPDDTYAHTYEAHTSFHGKTEAWYILEATSDANVTYGLERPSNRAEFTEAVEAGKLEPLLNHTSVRTGDVIFVPAKTLHAINEGIILFEIQQKSDLTYRVYDYGRLDAKTGQPRELHLEKALEVADFAPPPHAKIAPLPLDTDNSQILLIACSLFALERLTLLDQRVMSTNPGTFEILTVIEGSCTITSSVDAVELRRGDSTVLPATLGGYILHSTHADTPLQILRVYVPDLEKDFLQPMRAQNLDEKRIAATVIHNL
ncbi:MAG: mannose-6-phosphate isomerase [Chloroflexi bacterium AL-W]|nr:mannose-6-phosphate isomerase [Chloroflexi bacterium AL-N1]NOK65564.1 mannose-6-phosphate isomerase [Chloroflexi bacterium AL-N10]NOK74495.1 mannose-6-phosphate isomerase [Chloroflexi bacterium AL-N5]NOK80597.1 mannose-6-phosphate isomerase [Chloroflexi bacterium AL-W]NOK88753.1 mannose-6-phosphate isomerase [Chloroflexi bacterium AL-N15]